MGRVVQSVLGFLLMAVGVFIALWVDSRGDMLVIFFVAFGGFMVSKSLVTEFFTRIWSKVRGQGSDFQDGYSS